MRHHQPHRAAMLLLQRLAGPAMGEQGVFGGKIFQRQIGGVAVMRMQHHEPRLVARPAGVEEIAGRKPFPLIVVARPCRDAVDVGHELALRLRGELREIPEDRIFDRAVNVEPPALARNVRRQPEIERRPVLGQMLSRRQALLLGPRDLSGEEFSLARPALLAARQLAFGRRLVVVGHVPLLGALYFGALGSIGVVPRTPRISSSTFAAGQQLRLAARRAPPPAIRPAGRRR